MTPEFKATWDDFEWFVDTYVPRQTVHILKQFSFKLEEQTRRSVGLRSGDKKADIVSKIVMAFRALRRDNNLTTYGRIRYACELVGAAQQNYSSYPQPTFGGVPAQSGSAAVPPYRGYSNAGPSTANAYATSYAAPRNNWSAGASAPNAYSSRGATLHDWKPNPMWKAVRAITNMEMLPDIAANENAHTRKEKRVHFSLPQDIMEKVQSSKLHENQHPQYSIRIFCTSSDYYRPSNLPYNPATAHITNQRLPIEYPSSPDVYINDSSIPFKERGLRGKAGSAPPFDLDKGSRGLPKAPNTMIVLNMGHTGPTVGKKKDQSKRFFFQIVYCEITSKAELGRRISSLVPTTAEASLQMLRRDQDEDDFEVGSSRLSLRDPLSYMRIEQPVRSVKCTHVQCFEARWWLEGNEKHPQWLCPLCNKELRFEDLTLDGYSLDILKAVPDSYDEVLVESDYAWHTEDNKFGSANWTKSRANSAPKEDGPTEDTPPPVLPSAAQSASPASEPSSPVQKGKRKAIEILSSDSEDERPNPRPNVHANGGTGTANGGHANGHSATSSRIPLPRIGSTSASTSSRPMSAAPQQPPPGGVIDLTLSSDEDDTDDDTEAFFRRPGAGGASYSGGSRALPHQTSEAPVARQQLSAGAIPHLPFRQPSFQHDSSRSSFLSNPQYSNPVVSPPLLQDTWRPSNERDKATSVTQRSALLALGTIPRRNTDQH